MQSALRSAVAIPALLLYALTSACGPEEPIADPPARTATPSPASARPSILLVVIDTLRRDAVSGYGSVTGSTPHLDALAAEGLLYRNAFSPSPWTLPSHASLFTGASVSQHGVGLRGRTALSRDFRTLAERFSEAGYQTAGFSENPLVAPDFGFDRGFEQYRALSTEQLARAALGQEQADLDVVEELDAFLRRRDAGRPFFVFVNLYGAHAPYEVREINPFLAQGVDLAEARAAAAQLGLYPPLCDRLPGERDLEILRGLYLGDVAAADRQLGQIVRQTRAAAGEKDMIALITSDHGEHLGEHRLLGHEYSLRNVALSVPLVVHGLPGAPPGEIGAVVGLTDVFYSILCWSRLGECERALPTDTTGGVRATRSLIALYSDEPKLPPDSLRDHLAAPGEAQSGARRGCGPEDRVYGRLLSLTEYPLKLIWYENNPAELFDLRWDTRERTDLVSSRPDEARRMTRTALRLARQSGLLREPAKTAPAIEPGAAEQLRSLGYAE